MPGKNNQLLTSMQNFSLGSLIVHPNFERPLNLLVNEQMFLTHTTTDNEHSLRLEDLLPNTVYNVWVRMRPAAAGIDGGRSDLWSESLHFRTATQATGKKCVGDNLSIIIYYTDRNLCFKYPSQLPCGGKVSRSSEVKMKAWGKKKCALRSCMSDTDLRNLFFPPTGESSSTGLG